MSQAQYIRFLERELNKLNKVIDQKILRGEDYRKLARDHKLLLKKIEHHSRDRRGFLARFFQSPFQFSR